MTANILATVVSRVDACGESEISNLDAHTLAEKQIAQLEIAVNDALFVHVLRRVDDLLEIVARLGLGEFLARLDEFHHRLCGEFRQTVAIRHKTKSTL